MTEGSIVDVEDDLMARLEGLRIRACGSTSRQRVRYLASGNARVEATYCIREAPVLPEVIDGSVR